VCVSLRSLAVDSTIMSTEPSPQPTPASSPLVPPQRKLADKLASDWAWLSEMYNNATAVDIRQNVTGARTQVMSVVDTVQGMRASADAAATRISTPPNELVNVKRRFLDFRREYKGFLVGGIALSSVVVPIVGPIAVARMGGTAFGVVGGRLEHLRVAARNFFVAGGGAAVLLWPEITLSTAPKVSEKLDYLVGAARKAAP
jgi:hypothetical protein